nr:sortase [Psychromicrobium sp. YIM S02556]
MARIQIPSINVDLPVYHGTSDQVRSEGAGHLEGTSLPVGGTSTHTRSSRGIEASLMRSCSPISTNSHRETSSSSPCSDESLRTESSTNGCGSFRDGIAAPQDGRDLATLVTCTPWGSTPSASW